MQVKTDFNSLIVEVQELAKQIKITARAQHKEMTAKHAEDLEQNAFNAYRNRDLNYLTANLETLKALKASLIHN